jgi:hypothetical protein
MRLPRILAIVILIVSAIASFALAAAGCGGDNGTTMTDDMGPTVCTTRGTLTIDTDCMSDCDCVDPDGICTKAPYDRKVNPVCTIKCDPTMPDPRCTQGCNMKGYCKLP